MRLAARRGALRAALDRRDLGEAAWAASRLRLPNMALDPTEAAVARRVRAAVGRAIREARRRRAIFGVVFRQPVAPRAPVPIDRGLARELALVWAVALAVGLVVGVLQVFQPPEGGTDGGAPLLRLARRSGEAAAGAAQPLVLRGRTAPEVVAPPPVFEARERPSPTPPPTPPPPTIAPVRSVAAVAVASPAASGGPGGVASGGASTKAGTGSGSGGGPGAGTRPALPKAPPPPAIVPEGFSRVRGRVVDAATGKPVADVCLVIGVQTCGPFQPYTDEAGSFTVDLPIGDIGIFWRIVLTKAGYEVAERRIVSTSGGVLLGDIKLKPIANGR